MVWTQEYLIQEFVLCDRLGKGSSEKTNWAKSSSESSE